MKKLIVLVVFIFPFSGVIYGQQINRLQVELSGFSLSGHTPRYSNSLDIQGIALAYSKYVFKKFNFGGELGFGSISGTSRSGIFERFEELGDNRNYFHYRFNVGYEPIQKERFSFGIQTGFLALSYAGITERWVGGPGQIGDNPETIVLGRLSNSFFLVGPYAIFKFTDNLFIKPQYNRGFVLDRSTWYWNSYSVGLGYRF
ncbi:MAG: hypothetical protein ACXIUD_00755 [Mongoliitalea sp.]